MNNLLKEVVGRCRTTVFLKFTCSAGAEHLFFSFSCVRQLPNSYFFRFYSFGTCRTSIFLVFDCSAGAEQRFSLTQLLFHEATTYTTPHHTLKNYLLIFYERKNKSRIVSIYRSSNEKILSVWKSEKSYIPIKITGIFFCTRKEVPSCTRFYVSSYLVNGFP